MHIVTPSCQQRNGPRVIAVTLTLYYTQRPVEIRLLFLQERHVSHVNTKNYNARRYSGTTLRPKNGSLSHYTPFQFLRLPVGVPVSMVRDFACRRSILSTNIHMILGPHRILVTGPRSARSANEVGITPRDLRQVPAGSSCFDLSVSQPLSYHEADKSGYVSACRSTYASRGVFSPQKKRNSAQRSALRKPPEAVTSNYRPFRSTEYMLKFRDQCTLCKRFPMCLRE